MNEMEETEKSELVVKGVTIRGVFSGIKSIRTIGRTVLIRLTTGEYYYFPKTNVGDVIKLDHFKASFKKSWTEKEKPVKKLSKLGILKRQAVNFLDLTLMSLSISAPFVTLVTAISQNKAEIFGKSLAVCLPIAIVGLTAVDKKAREKYDKKFRKKNSPTEKHEGNRLVEKTVRHGISIEREDSKEI